MKKASKAETRIVRWDSQPGRKLSKAERVELEKLAALPDRGIDTSDAPELPAEVWRNAAVGKFYRPVKRPVTMRLDADVIDWLKQKAGPNGRGYQTAANRLLRAKMLAEMRGAGKRAGAAKA
ncbi:BrnA antitoxin family protein [Silvibacterium sp.]|uniref:BrnA antitoxin family protein n=1 Tax=Silvibacterium sp. TaxID=1964179 RepID=UPI0039E2CCE3